MPAQNAFTPPPQDRFQENRRARPVRFFYLERVLIAKTGSRFCGTRYEPVSASPVNLLPRCIMTQPYHRVRVLHGFVASLPVVCEVFARAPLLPRRRTGRTRVRGLPVISVSVRRPTP